MRSPPHEAMKFAFKCTSFNRKSQSNANGMDETESGRKRRGSRVVDGEVECLAKRRGNAALYLLHGRRCRQQIGHAYDRISRQSTRDDPGPVVHIRVYVEGKTMPGYPPGVYFDAYGGDLGRLLTVLRPAAWATRENVRLHPHACEARNLASGDAHGSQGDDQALFQLAHIADVIRARDA